MDDLPASRWLGCLVPKRHARRAVTRNLVKRQARAAFVCGGDGLPGGLWLLRLKQGFPIERFPSARSEALALALRDELDALLAAARARAA